MKSINFRIIGVIVAVAVFVGVLILVNSFDLIIEGQYERNYNRFVQNADGLTKTFRSQVEECVDEQIDLKENCMKKINEEFAVQFGSIVKLFGYDEFIQELYQLWQADLQYWHDSKKVQLQFSNRPEILELELDRISKIRKDSVQTRLQPEFASKIESNE